MWWFGAWRWRWAVSGPRNGVGALAIHRGITNRLFVAFDQSFFANVVVKVFAARIAVKVCRPVNAAPLVVGFQVKLGTVLCSTV